MSRVGTGSLVAVVTTVSTLAHAGVLPMPGFNIYDSPASYVAGDVDGDGVPDLVWPRGYDLAFAFGRGDGTFDGTYTLPTGVYVEAFRLAFADLDGDGINDLVASNIGAGSVSVLLTRGRLAYDTSTVAVPTTGDNANLVVGDFNADGKLDVVTSDICFLAGGPGGSLTAGAACASPVVGDHFVSLSAGDFDGDGRLDVARMGFRSSALQVFRGRGDGTFESPATTGLPFPLSTIEVADLDRDGRADLLGDGYQRGSVLVARSLGAGGFAISTLDSPPDFIAGVAIADVDGDGVPDVLRSSSSDGRVWMYRGSGDGSFGAPTPTDVGRIPGRLLVSDIDGDSDPDLIVLGATWGLAVRNVAGRLTGQTAVPAPDYAHGIAAADFNGDGLADIAISTDRGVTLLPGSAAGGSGAPIDTAVGPLDLRVVTGDFDGDGRPDLLAVASSIVYGYGPVVLTSNTDGTFTPHEAVPGFPAGKLLVADFDGDGRLDQAWFDSGLFRIARGRGDGTFEPPWLTYEVRQSDVEGFTAGDFDGDGRSDIAFAEYVPGSGNVLDIFWGQSDGTVTRGPRTFTFGLFTGAAIAADFDVDGRIDLAVSGAFFRGHGDGTFDIEAADFLSTTFNAFALDVDGDGNLDVVSAWTGSSTGLELDISLGDGNGNFTEERERSGSGMSIPGTMAVGDFDHDGRPDFALAFDRYPPAVLILPNLARPANQPPLAAAGMEQTLEVLVPVRHAGHARRLRVLGPRRGSPDLPLERSRRRPRHPRPGGVRRPLPVRRHHRHPGRRRRQGHRHRDDRRARRRHHLALGHDHGAARRRLLRALGAAHRRDGRLHGRLLGGARSLLRAGPWARLPGAWRSHGRPFRP